MSDSNIHIENKIVMKKLTEIKPYIRNPRKNDRTVELLCKIIPKVGFNVPIVIDSDGVIVKGHARFMAAIKLNMPEVPCIVTHADAEAIKADRIADNKISEFSEWVNDALLHEIDMIDLDFDFEELGFPKPDFSDIPTFDDFGADVDDGHEMSEEERQKLYAEFLEKQAKENAVEVQMTTESAMKAAVAKQANMPKAHIDYLKCTCEKCGNVMYVDKNIVFGKNGMIRRK